MSKRMVATSLWLFAGWYVGAAVAAFLGLSELVGLPAGIVVASIVARDPFRVLWKSTATYADDRF